jgi:hypothetical protein
VSRCKVTGKSKRKLTQIYISYTGEVEKAEGSFIFQQ